MYDMWVKDELAQTLEAHAKHWSRWQPGQLYDGSAIPNTPVGSVLDLWDLAVVINAMRQNAGESHISQKAVRGGSCPC
jgi:hypothetical protein